MLALTRKLGEKIVIAGDITLTVLAVERGRVRIGIEAPRELPIYRAELLERNNELDPDLAVKPVEWQGHVVHPHLTVSDDRKYCV
jgi:carbon storage regulator